MFEDDLMCEQPYNLSQCPYNYNHKFHSSKYFAHISRCKQGPKVRHLYQTCQFNMLHILPKWRIEQHEAMCPDGAAVKEKQSKLKEVVAGMGEPTRDKCMEDCQQCRTGLQQLGDLAVLVKVKKKDRIRLGKLLGDLRNLWSKENKLLKFGNESPS